MAAHMLNASMTGRLSRSLKWHDLLIYGLIFMVVIAPFGIFGSVFQASAGMVALAYIGGAAAMLLTASSYGVMVQAYPSAGSVYTYAGRAVAPWVGFLTGWAVLLDYVLVPALLSLVAAASMTAVLPSVSLWTWEVGFVVLNTVLNLFGIKVTKQFNRVFLVAELAVLAIYLVVGISALADGKGRGFAWEPLFNSGTFSLGMVMAAVSVSSLSFLGFDAISTLAEDSESSPRQIGAAMMAALGVTGLLFIAQTWVAALLVPDPVKLIAEGDAAGTAFHETARVAGGAWLATLTAVATALAWGLANNMVAQVATSRLLFAMGRDHQLPSFLARVTLRRSVPAPAILITAAVSLGLGLFMAVRGDGIALLASLVNFGAMIAFTVLHASVIYRYFRQGRQGSVWRNVLVPAVGIGVLLAVVVHANILAQRVGLAWIVLGVLVLLALFAAGRRPRLSGIDTLAEPTVAAVQVPAGSHV